MGSTMQFEMAQKIDNEIVFMAAGFETTAPTTAAELVNGPPENFSVLSNHRLIPPALKFLIESGEVNLNALIEPGHVSNHNRDQTIRTIF